MLERAKGMGSLHAKGELDLNFLFLLNLKLHSMRGDELRTVRYRDQIDDPLNRELCNMVVAVIRFNRRDDTEAQTLFNGSYLFFRERDQDWARYLKIFNLIYLSLVRRNIDAAAAYARKGQSIRPPFLIRSIFPIPDLEDKVLFKNTIEATG